MRAGDSGREPAGYAVVGRVVAFCIAGGVVFVLPVAILWLVEGVPDGYVFVVAADDECRVVEVVVYNSRIGPGAVGVEKCEGCVCSLLARR